VLVYAVDEADERRRTIARELAASVELHVPSVADVIKAAERAARDRIHHHDALIVQAASAAGCDVLLTEDLQDGRRFDGVTVTDPFR
jgi:predicted nucleic acid-binding protein